MYLKGCQSAQQKCFLLYNLSAKMEEISDEVFSVLILTAIVIVGNTDYW